MVKIRRACSVNNWKMHLNDTKLRLTKNASHDDVTVINAHPYFNYEFNLPLNVFATKTNFDQSKWFLQ